MRRVPLFGLALVVLVVPLASSPAGGAPRAEPRQPEPRAAYAQLPLAFVPNAGQTDPRVRFQAQAGGASFFFTRREVVMSFRKGERRGYALALRFPGASAEVAVIGGKQLPGRVNYLRGNDPTKWQTGLATYGEVVYRELWPGIDLVFHGTSGKLKYEFRLEPGARVSDIRLTYAGATRLALTEGGALTISTPLGVLTDEAPVSHQRVEGKWRRATSAYRLLGRRSVGFEVGAYDRRYLLVIDPGLSYSTFLGGGGHEEGSGIAVDRRGSAYVAGTTTSIDFPTTRGAFDRKYSGGFSDVFVTKLNRRGRALVYSTYLGGAGEDSGLALALDPAGNAYITGATESADFPTTGRAFDRTYNGGVDGDAFVTKLDASGSALGYSTYLGSTGGWGDWGYGIVQSEGNAYVTGLTRAADFPTTPGAFDRTYGGGYGDVFVTKMSEDGSALVYSTFLGAESDEAGLAIAVDRAGSAFATGFAGQGFPTTPGAYDETCDNSVAFVTKLNAAGSGLVYSTCVGGSIDDGAWSVAVDPTGSAYVAGVTLSNDFPTTPGAFDRTYNGGDDVFVTKLNAAGSALVYSTFLGGTSRDSGLGIALDDLGNAQVTGLTRSAGFPTTPGAFDESYNGIQDAFLTKLSSTGSGLAYSTFLGGGVTDQGTANAVDRSGKAYVTGMTTSPSFPTTPRAFDRSHNSSGYGDVFVTKLPTE
jgi:hypothetical protein